MPRRVVITGLGVVSPVGNNVDEFWQSLIAGRSGIRPITYFDASHHRSRIAGELKGFNADAYVDRKDQKWLDPFVVYATAATRMALEDSKINLSQEELTRVGVIIGSAIGGVHSFETQHNRLLGGGPGRVSPFFIPTVIVDMACGFVSVNLGAKGPNYGVASGAASGAHAIGQSYRSIQRGESDVVFCGGADAAISPLSISGFENMRVMSTRNDDPQRASRPFDGKRDGLVLGEGAGIVVLEEYEHALRRSARIYAEMVGYGLSADAYHVTIPAAGGEGLVLAMNMAMRDAGLTTDDVDYINAHGTSTRLSDRLETQAIKKVFGERAPTIPVSSNKSMIGNLLGAGGAVELVATVLTIKEGVIPPTINYEVPDPDCDLDYVPNVSRRARVRVGLSNSLAFGGHNVTLAARQIEP